MTATQPENPGTKEKHEDTEAPTEGQVIADQYLAGARHILTGIRPALTTGWRETTARLTLTAFLAALLISAITQYAWILALLVLAVAAIPIAVGKHLTDEPDDQDEDNEDGAAEELDVIEFVELLQAAIGTANGTHLATVATLLDATGLAPGWTVTDTREQCALLGIHVRPSLKVAGKVNVGVHRDDLAAALSTPPLADLAATQVAGSSAGQDATTPATTYPATPTVERYEGGLSIIRMPGEGQHHTV